VTLGLIAARLPGAGFLRVLVERRSLIHQMMIRDFRQRFVGSAAGYLWTLIHPLVLLVSWVFVFQWCLKVPPPPGAGGNYTLYLFCGYLPWLLFQDTVQRTANSLVEQSALITKTVFPSEIIPVSMLLSALSSHLIAVSIAVVMVRYLSGHFSVMIVFLPLYTLLLALFTLGLGWIVASLQVFLRDTAQILVVALTGWFWATPIFIDETHFPEKARFLVKYNPLALVVRGYRQRLMGSEPPSLADLALLAAIAVAVFIAGGMFFRHLKRGFADVL
jgi:ABC-type polysaccharide/polyol phosphate export permease